MTTDPDQWWTRAACKGLWPLFDAAENHRQGSYDARQRKENAERLERAARVCARCPVIRECDADWHLERDEGIRAGKVLPPIFGADRKAS